MLDTEHNNCGYWSADYLNGLGESLFSYIKLDLDTYKKGANIDTIAITLNGQPLKIDTGKFNLITRIYSSEYEKARVCIPRIKDSSILTKSDEGEYTIRDGVVLDSSHVNAVYELCHKLDCWLATTISELKASKTLGKKGSKAKIQLKGKDELFKLAGPDFLNLKMFINKDGLVDTKLTVDEVPKGKVAPTAINDLIKPRAQARVLVALPSVSIHQQGISISNFVNIMSVKNPEAELGFAPDVSI